MNIKTFLEALDILIVIPTWKAKVAYTKQLRKVRARFMLHGKMHLCTYNSIFTLHLCRPTKLLSAVLVLSRHFDWRVGVSPNVMHRCRIVLLFMFLKANLDRRQLHLIKKSCKKWDGNTTVSVYTIASHRFCPEKMWISYNATMH